MSDRVGPFEIVRDLVRGPGIAFAEGRGPDGERRLLQIARLRAPRDDLDRAGRRERERELALRTAELATNGRVDVHAHGGTDAASGERLLFWALPWNDETLLVDRLRERGLTANELVAVGLEIAHHLERRHERGDVEPLLSEHIVGIDTAGHASLLGVPVSFEADWLPRDCPPIRLAPEERAHGEYSRSGDIWRLGRLLSNASEDTDDLPDTHRRCFEQLCREDIRERVPDASHAVAALAALGPNGTSTPNDQGGASATHESAARTPRSRPPTPFALDQVATEIEAPMSLLQQVTTTSSVSGSVSYSATIGPAPRPTTDRAAIEALAAVWEQPVLPQGESPWSEVVHTRGTERRARRTFPGIDGELEVPANACPRRLADASPRGSPRVARSAYGQQLGAHDGHMDPGTHGTGMREATQADVSDVDIEAMSSMSGFNARKVALGVLTSFAIFGFFVLVARVDSESQTPRVPVISSANEFVLDSEPANAAVVAAADGWVLGKTPLAFLVPSDGATVFLAAPGHEPLRLELPSRGRIVARLEPITAAPCTVHLSVADGAAFEGVFDDIGPGPDHSIAGATLVRGRGGSAGALLVRCPSLGGTIEQRLRFPAERRSAARLRVVEPAGATAFLNGDPMGTIPAIAHTDRAFSLLRVDDSAGGTIERWIPSEHDVEVHVPAPRAEPVPLADRALRTSDGNTHAQLVAEAPLKADARGIRASRASKPGASEEANGESLLAAGLRDLLAGQPESARTRLVECTERDPLRAECHRVLGLALQNLGRADEAQVEFRRYLEIAPNAVDAPRIRRMLAN